MWPEDFVSKLLGQLVGCYWLLQLEMALVSLESAQWLLIFLPAAVHSPVHSPVAGLPPCITVIAFPKPAMGGPVYGGSTPQLIEFQFFP